MAKQQESKPSVPEYIAALYDDPLRVETATRGRWLVGVSLAIILVIHFDASLLSSDSFPVSFPDKSKGVTTALAFVALLLLIEFGMRALMDAFREKEFQLLVAKFVTAESLERKERQAKAIDEQIDAATEDESDEISEPEHWWQRYFDESVRVRDRLEKLDAQLGERSTAIVVRAVRLWLEVTVPIALAILALLAWALR